MEGILSQDTIQELLKYPLLVMMLVVIWFNNKNIDRMAKLVEKCIEKMEGKR